MKLEANQATAGCLLPSVAFFKHREAVVGVTCASAGDLPSRLVLSQGVPLKPKFLLAGFKQLWPARRAVRSFLP